MCLRLACLPVLPCVSLLFAVGAQQFAIITQLLQVLDKVHFNYWLPNMRASGFQTLRMGLTGGKQSR